MRIQRLYIKSYGNLKDFDFRPDVNHQTSVVLGRNGAGKSNLIEALIEIFRDLESGNSSNFAYEIDYFIRDSFVSIVNNPDGRPKIKIKINNLERVSLEKFKLSLDEFLPKYVFAYYSGWNERLEKLFEKPTNELYKKWKGGSGGENIPLRRLFYCRKDYSQLVLLAFFLMDDKPEVKEFLVKFLGIKEFESALFVMHRPFWRGTGKPKKEDIENGDPVFWYARGAFQTFTDRLWHHSLAPIRNKETISKDFRDRKEDQERLYLFIKDRFSLKELIYPGEDETHFFAHLEGLYLCDLIDEVRVTINHAKAGLIRFDQLSEGEQQLLTVLGLMHFTKGEESLFLLDEPDTHLNPAWTYEYLSLLENQMIEKTSQLLITTHNPLMIGSLKKEQVRLLRRHYKAERFGTVAELPEEDPIGMGVDGLLQSEIFGLKSVLPPSVVDRLTKRYELLGIKNKTEELQAELESLTRELEEMGIAHTFPHPYFHRFSQALARNPIMNKKDFDVDEVAELEDITDELLQEIIEEKDKEGDK